jgi:hypothetical protein
MVNYGDGWFASHLDHSLLVLWMGAVTAWHL